MAARKMPSNPLCAITSDLAKTPRTDFFFDFFLACLASWREKAQRCAYILLVPAALLSPLIGCSEPPAGPADSGLSIPRDDRDVLLQPMPALSIQQQLDFAVGRSFFRNPWVTAPSSTTARDGLGPLFNANSCIGCHVRNGRGRFPDDIESNRPHGLAMHVGKRKNGAPHPRFGAQLQIRAVPGVSAEGRWQLRYETHRRRFADGHEIALRRPLFTVIDAGGEAVEDIALSPRLAPPLIGIGLLEAVPQTGLEKLVDPLDSDGDGISGRINRVPDRASGRETIGRFGWKAGQPSVRQQVAAAFSADLGVTSSLFSHSLCPPSDMGCRAAADGGDPEISDAQLDAVADYIAALAIPAFRDTDERARGWRLFRQANCHSCHVPALKTGEHRLPWLSNRTIHPFTDLLLHDMGEDLADRRPEHGADGREWRTAPLWGIGLSRKIAVNPAFLHDGRARTLLEAILWHGGEAESSVAEVLAMNADERSALLQFLNSL